MAHNGAIPVPEAKRLHIIHGLENLIHHRGIEGQTVSLDIGAQSGYIYRKGQGVKRVGHGLEKTIMFLSGPGAAVYKFHITSSPGR